MSANKLYHKKHVIFSNKI